jgi:LysM repeat protein
VDEFGLKLLLLLIVLVGVWLIVRKLFYVNSKNDISVITNLAGEVKKVTNHGVYFKLPGTRSAVNTEETYFYDAEFSVKKRYDVCFEVAIKHRINNDNSVVLELFKEFGDEFRYENKLFFEPILDRLNLFVSEHKNLVEVIKELFKVNEELNVKLSKECKEYGILIEYFQIKVKYGF